MRRLFATVLVLLLVFMRYGQALDFGLKAGFTVSKPDITYDSYRTIDFNHRDAFEVIVFVQQPLSSTFRYSLGIGYAERGVKGDFPIIAWSSPTVIGGSFKRSEAALKEGDISGGFVKYLTVPLMFEAALPAKGLSPYLAVGPRVMINIGESHDDAIERYFNDLKNVTYGATFALGGEVPVSTRINMFGEFAYSPDFSYAVDVKNYQVKNSAVTFFAGFRF